VTSVRQGNRFLSLSIGQWLVLWLVLVLVLPLQLRALGAYPSTHAFADKEMASRFLRLFGHEYPLATLRPYFPYLMVGQAAAVVVAVKLRWRLGLVLVAVLPLLWVFLVDWRFSSPIG
jgi:Na+(H+)/acetate symporter ActP